MDLIYWIGIYIAYILLFSALGISIYFNILTRNRVKLNAASYSFRDNQNSSTKLKELDVQLNIELRNKRFNSILHYLFSIVNFVIGTLLSSSFIQETIEPKILGWAGIAIVSAVLLNQLFKPEKKREIAAKRIAQISKTKRKCEEISNKYNIDNEPDVKQKDSTIWKIVDKCLNALDEERANEKM